MVTTRWCPIALLVVPVIWATPARADEPAAGDEPSAQSSFTPSEMDQAQGHYQRGVQFFKDAIYDAALVEFRRAYEIAPSYKILYNIGQVSRQLEDCASAVDAYERYLRDGGARIPPARVEEVTKEIEKLNARVGRLEVVTNRPALELAVDDRVVGRTPFSSPIPVNAGRRKVTVTAPGRPPLTRVLDVAGGETAKLDLDSLDEGTSVAGASGMAQPKGTESRPGQATTPAGGPSGPPPVLPSSVQKPPWLLWGVTAVLAVGAVSTGVLALDASSDIERVKRRPVVSTHGYDSAHSRMLGLAITTDVLTGLALVTGGIATYLTFRSSPAEKSLAVSVAPGSLKLQGRF